MESLGILFIKLADCDIISGNIVWNGVIPCIRIMADRHII